MGKSVGAPWRPARSHHAFRSFWHRGTRHPGQHYFCDRLLISRRVAVRRSTTLGDRNRHHPAWHWHPWRIHERLGESRLSHRNYRVSQAGAPHGLGGRIGGGGRNRFDLWPPLVVDRFLAANRSRENLISDFSHLVRHRVSFDVSVGLLKAGGLRDIAQRPGVFGLVGEEMVVVNVAGRDAVLASIIEIYRLGIALA